MTIEENIEIINQIVTQQRVVAGLKNQLREGAAEVTVCNCEADKIHIFKGIDVLAAAFDCSLDIQFLSQDAGALYYPYRVSLRHAGVEYYQWVSADDYKTFVASSVVPISEEVTA